MAAQVYTQTWKGEAESLPANLRGKVESLRANLRGGAESLRANFRWKLDKKIVKARKIN